MINDNIGTLFEGDPSAPAPMALRQGVVESWDPDTGENSIQIAGGTLVNLPSLTAESAELVAGDVVALLSVGDRALVLGKVTTPGDPGTVPTWNADLTALAPLVDLAAITDGTTVTGATQATAEAGSGARIVLNDLAYPNELIIESGQANETAPARLLSVVPSGLQAQAALISPELDGGSSAAVSLMADAAALGGKTHAQIDADNIVLNSFVGAPWRPARTVYKTADTTINNSTTLATDPELQITGIPAGTYAWEALIIYSASAVADWKGFFQSTAGSITDRLHVDLREPLAGLEYGVSDGAVTFTAAGAGVGTKRAIRVVGTFVATADAQGHNLQWAQNTAEATNTVVHRGSFYRIQKIA